MTTFEIVLLGASIALQVWAVVTTAFCYYQRDGFDFRDLTTIKFTKLPALLGVAGVSMVLMANPDSELTHRAIEGSLPSFLHGVRLFVGCITIWVLSRMHRSSPIPNPAWLDNLSLLLRTILLGLGAAYFLASFSGFVAAYLPVTINLLTGKV